MLRHERSSISVTMTFLSLIVSLATFKRCVSEEDGNYSLLGFPSEEPIVTHENGEYPTTALETARETYYQHDEVDASKKSRFFVSDNVNEGTTQFVNADRHLSHGVTPYARVHRWLHPHFACLGGDAQVPHNSTSQSHSSPDEESDRHSTDEGNDKNDHYKKNNSVEEQEQRTRHKVFGLRSSTSGLTKTGHPSTCIAISAWSGIGDKAAPSNYVARYAHAEGAQRHNMLAKKVDNLKTADVMKSICCKLGTKLFIKYLSMH